MESQLYRKIERGQNINLKHFDKKIKSKENENKDK